jgi:excinuclease ABC subunit B
MYADNVTDSMQNTIDQTSYRRTKQMDYNEKNNVVPTALHKKIETALDSLLNTSKAEDKFTTAKDEEEIAYLLPHEIEEMIKKKRKEMQKAAQDLDFMQAAKLRDQIKELEVQKKG